MGKNHYTGLYGEEDFKKKCYELDLIYLNSYKNIEHKSEWMINFICKKHFEKGIQTSDWGHFKNYTMGCKYCAGRNKTDEDVQKEIGENIVLLSHYNGADKPIKCMCKTCGNVWFPLARAVISNKSGCPICGIRIRGEKRRKSEEQFKEDLKKVNPDFEVIGNYKGTHKKIRIKCKKCNCEFESYPANLLNKSAGCPSCNMSNGEKYMLTVLDNLGIKYISQYPIKVKGYKNNFRFDAYDEKNKIAYEYQGQGHYFPVDFAGKGEEWAREEFEYAIQRDKDKEQYCLEHGIKLVAIPYTEINNMESIIKNSMKGG